MECLLSQAPQGLTEDFINEIFIKNNNDINKTLLELWEIPEETVKEISEERKNWNDIRETCDAYDNEMTRLISNVKNSIKKEEE